MDQTTLTLKMLSALEQIQKASEGDPEALKIVCRFAVESVRTDIHHLDDKAVKEQLRKLASEIMAELRD